MKVLTMCIAAALAMSAKMVASVYGQADVAGVGVMGSRPQQHAATCFERVTNINGSVGY